MRQVGIWLIGLVLLVPAMPAPAADAPLVEATKEGDLARVRQLLENSVALASSEADGTTALH